MQGIVETIHRILGMKPPPSPPCHRQQVLPPSEHLKHIEQNIRAITSSLDPIATPIVLHEMIEAGGVLTDVEIRADRIHLIPAGQRPSQVVRLDDSLQSYQQLDEELRCQLARKIARLAPALAHSKKKLLLEHTLKVLKTLAQDQTERVRMMIAEELADQPEAPFEVVRELACDPSLRVSRCILEFSPLLRDDDLLDILASSPMPGVAEAIAQRRHVSAQVGNAIVKTAEPVAIRHLLSNQGAELSAQAISTIVDHAPEHEIWHEPLSQRPELTQKTINRIAGFMSHQLLADLQQQGKIQQKTGKKTKKAVQKRLDSWSAQQEREAELRVRQLHSKDRLTEDVISDAIDAVNGPFVMAALAIRTGIDKEIIRRIMRSQSGKALTSLAWRAGLSMRTAMSLQMKIGRVHHAKMVNAKGGTDYPIDEGEMQTYLEIFTG